MERNEIKRIALSNDYLASKLYCRGFLLSNKSFNLNDYPFCGKWEKADFGFCSLYYHFQTVVSVKQHGRLSIGIIGNVFNPFDKEIDNNNIADKLFERYLNGFSCFIDYFNQLTGVFTLIINDDEKIKIFCDPVGLYSTFYYDNHKEIFVSSHSNLIGDLLDLQQSDYMCRLKKCRTYKYFGYQLPGIITQFETVKRVSPNHYLEFSNMVEQIRFYYPHYDILSEDKVCDNLIEILENTMECISNKWKSPAISLTGGCDSKTTLAASHKVYSRMFCFSYDSQPNEKPDADAAQLICDKIGMRFNYYHIPYEDSAFKNIDDVKSVLQWNCGDIRYNNPNDVRKRLFLDKNDDFDVEVKSWASEVGRSRYSKRYMGKRNFGKKPTARKCTTFYKFLLFDRDLVNKTDKIFKEYLKRYYQPSPTNPIPWQDQFYWEWHWPSRDGISLTCEQQFSNEITVPFNNRKILELLLSINEADRINDRVYSLIREKTDARIDEAASTIVDVNHTKKRAFLETVYYYVNNLLPY